MRNLKKFLALALAMVMTLSVMSVASAKTYSDSESITAKYAEAVDVLSGLQVFEGYTDGTFLPKGNITRAEVAAIIYRVATGDVTGTNKDLYADYNKFDDVTAERWFAGYVNYCANAVYVKGVGNNKFNPNGNVTGYEVLAMILRAVGYDQNNEWTGAGWETKVASTANELGITDTIDATETSLRKAATREVVAELLFRTITLANKVTYTPALGYNQYTSLTGTTKNPTLGTAVFGLSCSDTKDMDVWGRPGYEWTATKTAAKGVVASYTQTPVASYTVKVDECDIIKDLGLTKNAAVEAGYIDGVVSAVDDNATLEALATTKYVGAQGRLTEVYDMGKDGYRVVEINTYLGQVTKTTAATVDKNNHPVAATATVTVYVANGTTLTDTLTTDKYAVGDYVLVQLVPTFNAAKTAVTAISIEDTQTAEITTGGKVTTWTNAAGLTPSTTTVVSTVYNDADKFVLNYRDTSKAYSVAKDAYGNIIGLVPVATNYLVIEKIAWKQSNTTTAGGFAMADIVLSDGTRIQNVTIDEVTAKNGANAITTAALTNTGDQAGVVASRTVSDDYTNNTAYADHIYTYSVDANGAYDLVYQDSSVADIAPATITDYNKTTVVQGQATIQATNATNGGINAVVATANTVFLVGAANDTYTAYVGKDAVPSGSSNSSCVLSGADGYATLVVLPDYTLASNTFLAYVTDAVRDTVNGSVNGYYVYKLGETTPTVVYGANFTYSNTGLYVIEVDSLNNVVTMKTAATNGAANWVQDINTARTVSSNAISVNINTGLSFDRTSLKENYNATSIQTQGYSALTAQTNTVTYPYGYSLTAGTYNKDFSLTTDTKIINVTKNGIDGTATLSAGTTADLTAGKVVVVGYTQVGQLNVASVIYVYTVTYAPVAAASTQLSGAISKVWDANKGVVCAQNSTAYTSITEAVDEATNLNVGGAVTAYAIVGSPLVYNTDTVKYAVYTTTADAEKAAAGDFLAAGGGFATSLLNDGNVLVLEITVTTQNVKLDDGVTAAPNTLYVAYNVVK